MGVRVRRVKRINNNICQLLKWPVVWILASLWGTCCCAERRQPAALLKMSGWNGERWFRGTKGRKVEKSLDFFGVSDFFSLQQKHHFKKKLPPVWYFINWKTALGNLIVRRSLKCINSMQACQTEKHLLELSELYRDRKLSDRQLL